MIGSEYTLELCNVFHSGEVEPSSCVQRLAGSAKTGVILKDVSFAMQSGEVLAVLGSKGSGKRALLDVIARRAACRGHVLLEGAPLDRAQFSRSCGLVKHSSTLLPGLTVQQTLSHSLIQISTYMKSSKVKQVMADLALSQVAHKCVTTLNKSEYRRLLIGVQLIRDPVVLLLDEPTWELDPLNTYLVVSILANAAKKYGTAIILTMEKPRSDVFPFLERVVYLCLGDVVYSGPTRSLLDYFASIGFPCPQLENPLMYYLCLSTVDRRSQQRFIESNHQIAALVDKFKLEGQMLVQSQTEHRLMGSSKMHLTHGTPNAIEIVSMLYVRMLASIFNFTQSGMKQMFLRLFALPIYFFILWIFYFDAKNYQRAFITKSGLTFNAMAGAYFIGILNTVCLFGQYRTRYYQEAQEGHYGGATMLLAHHAVSLPFSLLSVLASTAIVYPIVGDIYDVEAWGYWSLALWSCYLLAEQQTIAVMMVARSCLVAAATSVYITCVYIMLASGMLRSYKGYEDWLHYLTYATHTRYASYYLQRTVFQQTAYDSLPVSDQENCTLTGVAPLPSENPPFLEMILSENCRFQDGKAFLTERFTTSRLPNDVFTAGVFNPDFNLGVSFAMCVGLMIIDMLLYAMPLPTHVKNKFRE